MNQGVFYIFPFISLATFAILVRLVISGSANFDSIALILASLLLFTISFFYFSVFPPSEKFLTQTDSPAVSSSQCPFASQSDEKSKSSDQKAITSKKFPKTTKQYEQILQLFKTKSKKVILLYEDYIHLPPLRSIWECPVTVSPRMEPYFASGCHGMEIAFLLLAEFVNDPRPYLTKRPRLDVVTHDLVTQCQLLGELLDGELEDTSIAASQQNNISTADKPPTVISPTTGTVSPSLDHLIGCVERALSRGSQEDRRALRNLVRTIISAFQANFGMWSVGLGLEHQLNQLCDLVGLPGLSLKSSSLDYGLMVRPKVVADTLFNEAYEHEEDFFFRSVHLGTDCWAFVVVSRLKIAKELAIKRQWVQSAAQVRFAAKVLNYLGDHVMMLVMMVLRDYLRLKVEIQGTSGEGSLYVKSFRSLVLPLFDVVKADLLEGEGHDLSSPQSNDRVQSILYNVYSHPEDFPCLYEYCKALEVIESAVTGGFSYKHFLLATNVIGSDAKGTMGRSVEALKSTYETCFFPILDSIRYELGENVSKQFAGNHAKIMNRISARHGMTPSSDPPCDPLPSDPPDLNALQRLRLVENNDQSPEPVSRTEVERFVATNFTKSPVSDDLDLSRRALYLDNSVTPSLINARKLFLSEHSFLVLHFLDHGFGFVPPLALNSALSHYYSMVTGAGNYSWDLLFSESMPKASQHIKRLLNIEDDPTKTISFGHNSHELCTRILSHNFDRLLSANPLRPPKLTIITSDSEFYSWTRQMNRLTESEASYVDVRVVPTHPLSSFEDRFIDEIRSAGSVDLVLVSQISFTQITLIPSIPPFVKRVKESLPGGEGIVIVDAYHGFAALPTSLQGVDAIYVAGTLKHASSGPNLSFAVVPECYSYLRPVFTGWLADLSALNPASSGIGMGSSVGYTPGLSLMGSTPSFHLSMILFNHVMDLWLTHSISVSFAHQHVMSLHDQFLSGLKALESEGQPNPLFNLNTLMKSDRNGGDLESRFCRSHTLVFLQPSPEDSVKAVQSLKASEIGIDSRDRFVRIGFGLNHNPEDVELLLAALRPL